VSVTDNISFASDEAKGHPMQIPPTTAGLPRQRLPATVRTLVLARAVNRLGAFTLPFLTVTLGQEFHASITQIGLLLAGFGLATIPSRLFGGALTDRIGGKATIIVGLCATAGAQLAIVGTRSLTQAAIAVVLLGLVFEIYEPPSQSMIADATPAEHRPAAFNFLAAATAAAGMAAGLLAAWVANGDLRWLFAIDALTCLACAGIVAHALPVTCSAPSPAAHKARPLADWRLLALLATGTVFATVYLQITIAMPLTLTARGQPATHLGLLLTVSAITMVLGQPLLRLRVLSRLDHFSAMTTGYLVLSGGMLATGFARTLSEFTAATVLWSLGDLVLLGRAYTIVAGIAPSNARGRYLAVYGISWGIASIAAPLVGTQLLQHRGPEAIWITCAAACLVLSTIQPVMRARLQQHK